MSLFSKNQQLKDVEEKIKAQVQEDVLTEDPRITGQKYALVSMVSPESIRNKCDVFAFKIRCTCKDMAEVKKMKERFMKLDNGIYSLYVVQVGLWTPFVNNEDLLPNTEYQETALNEIISGYVENRNLANDEFNERKNQMVREAKRDGTKKGQAELAAKKEHVLAVLTRKKTFEEQIAELQEKMKQVQEDLDISDKKYKEEYTEEEKVDAEQKLSAALHTSTTQMDKTEKIESSEPKVVLSMEELREKMMKELLDENEQDDRKTVPKTEMELVIEKLDRLHTEIEDLNPIKKQMMSNGNVKGIEKISEQILNFEIEIKTLKLKLNDSKDVNSFMAGKFGKCELDSISENPRNEVYYDKE